MWLSASVMATSAWRRRMIIWDGIALAGRRRLNCMSDGAFQKKRSMADSNTIISSTLVSVSEPAGSTDRASSKSSKNHRPGPFVWPLSPSRLTKFSATWSVDRGSLTVCAGSITCVGSRPGPLAKSQRNPTRRNECEKATLEPGPIARRVQNQVTYNRLGCLLTPPRVSLARTAVTRHRHILRVSSAMAQFCTGFSGSWFIGTRNLVGILV